MPRGVGGGRPTKYKPEYVEQARKLAKLGATDFEVAQFFNVSVKTVDKWKIEHPKFVGALKLGKTEPDARVKRSLYSRATGYTYDAEELFLVDHTTITTNPKDKKNPIVVKTKKVVRVPVVKHVPPDPTSCIFWLKNREPTDWRAMKAVEVSTPPGKPFEVAGVATEPELIGAYYARLKQSQIAAGGSATRADSDPDQDVDRGGQGPKGRESDSETDQG